MHIKFKHKKQLYIFVAIISVLLVLIGLMVVLSGGNSKSLNVTEFSKRGLIETAYPEFKNYEFQDSFAGKVTMYEQVGEDYYMAYVENGSGVPIVAATCFKVDADLKVTKIGTYPDPLDTQSYQTIDLKTCEGIWTK
jgi:hypothetical protein